MQCQKCCASYIGYTSRFLHTRINEHLKQRQSAVFQHTLVCKSTWKTYVIKKCRDTTDMQISEAYAIDQQKPTLNDRDELAPFRLL